jgi:Xaa-Pro dipeptidase
VPLDRLREWMEVAGVRAAYVTGPISIGYLTGFHSDPHERLMALVVRPAAATLIVPGLDEEAARAAAHGVDVRAWRDGQDPWTVVSDALARAGAGGRVAVEKDHLSLAAWERLRVVTDGADAVDAGGQLRLLRARKAPWELELLGRAAKITDQVTELTVADLAVGSSELEVAMTIDLHIAEAGAQRSFGTLVQSGPNSALPHGRPGGRRLGVGDLVLLDFGAAWQGYRADTTRMAVVGEPDARQLEVYSVVLAAHDAAVGAVRAGAVVGDVDEAARAVIRAAGLGDRFIHRVGHGLGLEAHEDPSLDPGSPAVLEEGMVVTVEPGVYLPGWGGVRIEDDVVVEAEGGRLLTAARRELQVVG